MKIKAALSSSLLGNLWPLLRAVGIKTTSFIIRKSGSKTWMDPWVDSRNHYRSCGYVVNVFLWSIPIGRNENGVASIGPSLHKSLSACQHLLSDISLEFAFVVVLLTLATGNSFA